VIQTYGIDTNVDIVIAGDTDYGIGNSIDDSIDTLFTRIHSIHSTAYDAGKCVYRIVEIHELDGIHGIHGLHAVHTWAPGELNDVYTVLPRYYHGVVLVAAQTVIAQNFLYDGPKISYMMAQKSHIWWAENLLYDGPKFPI
jgi:hypothetical protein